MKKLIKRIWDVSKNNPLRNFLLKPILFLRIKKNRRKRRKYTTLSLFNKIKKKKIRGILHIGAHLGGEYDFYKNLSSNLIFFEPLPNFFKILEERLKDKAILVNKALGNSNKKVMMYVDDYHGESSSILKPKLHLIKAPQIKFNEMVEVDMIKLDYFSELNPSLNIKENYNMICIDVQGYELEVFKGAIKTLRNIDYIISEINIIELYEGCVLVKELDEFLSKFKFKRVKTLIKEGTWGDALYVRKRKI